MGSSVEFDSSIPADSSSTIRRSRRRLSSAIAGSSSGEGKFSSIFRNVARRDIISACWPRFRYSLCASMNAHRGSGYKLPRNRPVRVQFYDLSDEAPLLHILCLQYELPLLHICAILGPATPRAVKHRTRTAARHQQRGMKDDTQAIIVQTAAPDAGTGADITRRTGVSPESRAFQRRA